MMPNKKKSQRLQSIDLLRGFAVLLMIIYHFFYDYGHFGYWDINLNVELEWQVFRYVIVSLFLFTVGVSLNMSHAEKIMVQSVIKRMIVLGGVSLIISIISFFQFPHSWIYFGIIHFILFASLSGLLLRRFPNICLILSMLIIVGSAQGYLHTKWLYQLIQPLGLPLYTEDIVHFFPWFGVVLLGMYFAHDSFCDLKPSGLEKQLQQTNNVVVTSLLFMGKNALIIYLIHQPILFAGFLLVGQVS